MRRILFFIISLFLLPALSVSANAQTAPAVCRYQGYANISTLGTTYNVNATHNISVFANNSNVLNATIFSNGFYVADVPGSNGDNITFTICGKLANQSYQTFSCAAIGYNTLNISANTSANSAVCTYNCGCDSNFCVHGICRASSTYCGDSFCDSGETSSSCSADCGAAPGGGSTGGGGGGGGAAATTTTTAIAAPETSTIASIAAGSSANITIQKPDDLKIESIVIDVKNSVSNVQITIKETALPSGTSVAISADSGAVFKYLEISKVNISDADISKAKIKFKVDKSWLDANGIDPATISLQKLVNNVWQKQPTTKISEDAKYVYYEAESPTLSLFAITGLKKAVTPTATSPVVTTSSTTTPSIPTPPQNVIFVVVGLVIIVILVYLIMRRKTHKKSSPVPLP